MSETPEIRNLDLALLWADVEGAQKRGVLLPGATGKALASRINQKLREIDANLPENPRLRRRSLATIAQLTAQGLLDRKLSVEIIRALPKPLDVIPTVDSRGLRVRIEEVKKRARREMWEVAEEELLIAPLSKVIAQDPLEGAVDTLNAINSWVAEGTWTHEYFSRIDEKEIRFNQLFLPTATAFVGISSWLVGMVTSAASSEVNFAGVAFLVGGGVFISSFFMDDGGHVMVKDQSLYVDSIPMNVQKLQREWDNGNHKPVEFLAKLNRIEAAQEIQAAIN